MYSHTVRHRGKARESTEREEQSTKTGKVGGEARAAHVIGEEVDGGGREWQKWNAHSKTSTWVMVARQEVASGEWAAACGGRPWGRKGGGGAGEEEGEEKGVHEREGSEGNSPEWVAMAGRSRGGPAAGACGNAGGSAWG